MNEKRAFSVAETAKYACVSRSTIELWLAKRLLPFEEFPGQGNGRKKFRRIRKKDLDAFLDKYHKAKSEQEKIDISNDRNQLNLFPQEHGAALLSES